MATQNIFARPINSYFLLGVKISTLMMWKDLNKGHRQEEEGGKTSLKQMEAQRAQGKAATKLGQMVRQERKEDVTVN